MPQPEYTPLLSPIPADKEMGAEERRELRRRFHPLLVCALIVWIAGVGAGFARVMAYALTPGDRHPSPTEWPADCSIRPDSTRANLVLLAHPHCPCMRASVEELDHILTRCQGRLAAHVLFYRPNTFPENWEKTDIWDRAAAIPGVQVFSDKDGEAARRFGAATSGHVLLYHADGRLLFSGGITNTRGHGGASAGADAIVSLLTKVTPVQAEFPVFGCPLSNPLSGESEGPQPCCQP